MTIAITHSYQKTKNLDNNKMMLQMMLLWLTYWHLTLHLTQAWIIITPSPISTTFTCMHTVLKVSPTSHCRHIAVRKNIRKKSSQRILPYLTRLYSHSNSIHNHNNECSTVQNDYTDTSNWEAEHTSYYPTQTSISNPNSSPITTPLNVLLLDNYDSYTYNLYQHLCTILNITHALTSDSNIITHTNISQVLLLPNDAVSSYSELLERYYEPYGIASPDCIIIGPGPGTPTKLNDVGVCADVIKQCTCPVLGVCLGHQLLGVYGGARVERAQSPMHGQVSRIVRLQSDTNDSDDDLLFEHVPNLFRAVRYHSLSVQPSTTCQPSTTLNSNASSYRIGSNDNTLEVLAVSEDDEEIMVMKYISNNTNRVLYGVQFHPESIGTQCGVQLLYNFCCIALRYKQQQRKQQSKKRYNTLQHVQRDTLTNIFPPQLQSRHQQSQGGILQQCCYIYPIRNSSLTPLQVFEGMYLHHSDIPTNQQQQQGVIWLDSSDSDVYIHDSSDDYNITTTNFVQGRYSILADTRDADGHTVWYNVYNRTTLVQPYNKNSSSSLLTYYNTTILDYLAQQQHQYQCTNGTTMTTVLTSLDDEAGTKCEDDDSIEVPFEYRGGYLGYIGYEVRYDTDPRLHPNIQHGTKAIDRDTNTRTNNDMLSVPDAVLLYAGTSMVYDAHTKIWYLVLLRTIPNLATSSSSSSVWMRQVRTDMKRKIHEMKQLETQSSYGIINNTTTSFTEKSGTIGNSSSASCNTMEWKWKWNRSKSDYLSDVKTCQEYIANGESYELCLTNQVHCTIPLLSSSSPSAFELYKYLRGTNPAPYSAYLHVPIPRYFHNNNCNENNDDSTSISTSHILELCCTSPERFLRVYQNGTMESKPIKGTIRREVENARKDTSLAYELQRSTKNRAENLMIVDLLRNDFSRVCVPGSIGVPHLMCIESYAKVHQMVSTIRGTLLLHHNDINTSSHMTSANTGMVLLDAIRSTFPGGSMTGAPKLRTCDILHSIEQKLPRGVYSGTLGYMNANYNVMDWNIVIRTAVCVTSTNTCTRAANNAELNSNRTMRVSIGAGGAITRLSNAEEEYDEMMLKSQALLDAVEYVYRRNK